MCLLIIFFLGLLYLFLPKLSLLFILISLSLGHGSMCACIGPVLDVQLNSLSLTYNSSLIDSFSAFIDLTNQSRYILIPCVYDSIIVFRPGIYLRDGTSFRSQPGLVNWLSMLPFNDSLLLSLSSLLPVDYSSELASSRVDGNWSQVLTDELASLNADDTLIGFTTAFMLTKSYSNLLLCEISQLCYGGILRTIALASTDGLCTWNVPFINMYQPVVIPVGRVTLGRIFNVTGSAIDEYMDVVNTALYSIECFYSLLTSKDVCFHGFVYVKTASSFNVAPSFNVEYWQSLV